MKRRAMSAVGASIVLAVLLSFGSPSQTQEILAQPPGTDALARGPIHEGFAQPDNPDPRQGAEVPRQPPAPIEELPPDQRPEGANVQWLPGYWAYDADAKDFIWISGCWRAAPPGRRWLPGHWQNTDRGWIFVSGFWAPEAVAQVQYLPAPPPTLDKGPSAPAPSVDHFYCARLLGLSRRTLLLAARPLGALSSPLGVAAGALRVDADRLPVHRGLLGLSAGGMRPAFLPRAL